MSTVKCPVHLHKNSVQIVPNKENPKKYHVLFRFDAMTSGTVTIFYGVKEKADSDKALYVVSKKTYLLSDLEFRKSTKPIKFEIGLNQKFEQATDDLLDPSECKEEEIMFSPDQVAFPVVVVLAADQSKTKKNEIEEEEEVSRKPKVSAQVTFTTLLKCSDESFVMKFVKQKVLVRRHKIDLTFFF